MADPVRIIAIGGAIGVVIAGTIVAPQVFAAVTDVPAKVVSSTTLEDIFPAPFDPKRLRKFDFSFDDTVSKEIKSTATVKKIGYGKATTVTIVTTPSGVSSSDAIASPYVRYPGVSVTPKYRHDDWAAMGVDGLEGKVKWTSRTDGSFTYLTVIVLGSAERT